MIMLVLTLQMVKYNTAAGTTVTQDALDASKDKHNMLLLELLLGEL
jgi:hypothetical protein